MRGDCGTDDEIDFRLSQLRFVMKDTIEMARPKRPHALRNASAAGCCCFHNIKNNVTSDHYENQICLGPAKVATMIKMHIRRSCALQT